MPRSGRIGHPPVDFRVSALQEGGTTPARAAVISAIVNALSRFHIRDTTLSATPFAVWQAIQRPKEAGGGHS
jgi:hypothetical protein